MNEKLLSLCLAGRNDNYGGNFKRRFVQAMNFLAWSARKADVIDKLEIVFADWNSDIPIAQDLQLSQDAAEMVRFIEIPPEMAKQYNSAFSPFSQSIAFNCAFRRAKGKFAGIMPADILLTSHSLRNLCGILQGNMQVDFDLQQSMLSIPRKLIPFSLDESSYFTSPEKIEKLLLSGNAFMSTDNKVRGLMGAYGCFLMSKDEIFKLRGVDERIAGWGYNDIDLALRGAEHIRVINTSGYGIWSYDFEASPAMVHQKNRRFAKVNPITLGHAENTVDWGLERQKLKESRCLKISAENPYTFFSAQSSKLSFRNWISCLSHRLPWEVENISSAALAAGQLSKEACVEKINLYGAKDFSIPAVLSLHNSFPALVIHQELDDERSFFGLWAYDEVLGAMHYQGPVSYVPKKEVAANGGPQMFIFDDIAPDWDELRQRKNLQDIFILSGRACKCQKFREFAKSYGMAERELRKTVVIAAPERLQDVDVSQWRPLNSGLSLRLFRRHRVKKILFLLRSCGAIFFRRQIWEWPEAFSNFWKFINSRFD